MNIKEDKKMKGGEEMFKKSELWSYASFFLALVAVGVFVAGLIPESTMLVILGVFGFAGIAALRQFVDSHGWKTWFSALMGFICVLLQIFGVFTPDALAKWLTIWGLLASGGLVHAVKKANG